MIIFAIVFLTYLLITLIRVELVYQYTGRKIDEAYDSGDMSKFRVSHITKAYNQACWDMRKWRYRDFFPEEFQ